MMKKVAIVGVEGSGKTVMLAGLGDLYAHPDPRGYFLTPKNFSTASYVVEKIAGMRNGIWPSATADDVLQHLHWHLRRKTRAAAQPEDVCEIACLDFAGEVYRSAFGIVSRDNPAHAREIVELKDYVRSADEIAILINLRDVITRTLTDPRVREAVWITRSILESVFAERASEDFPRVALVLTQADNYGETIRACGGAKGALERYLPDVLRDPKPDAKDQPSAWAEEAAGRIDFPLVRELLAKVQGETIPFEIRGSCQWGVNRTAKGWLVWLMNNEGVTKFAGEPEEFDFDRTAHVTVVSKLTGEAKSVTIEPGATAFLEF